MLHELEGAKGLVRFVFCIRSSLSFCFRFFFQSGLLVFGVFDHVHEAGGWWWGVTMVLVTVASVSESECHWRVRIVMGAERRADNNVVRIGRKGVGLRGGGNFTSYCSSLAPPSGVLGGGRSGGASNRGRRLGVVCMLGLLCHSISGSVEVDGTAEGDLECRQLRSAIPCLKMGTETFVGP